MKKGIMKISVIMKRLITKKSIKTVGLGLVLLIMIGLFISMINHKVRLKQELRILQDYGVGERIDVDGKDINIYSSGAKDAKHTIVYMQGLGMGDVTIAARPMLEAFEGNNRICIVNRYGTGLSEDTGNQQTVENIIKEYRSVLNKA